LHDFGAGNRGIDGMTVDHQGNVYAAAGRGELSGVYVFAPDGKQLALIAVRGTPTNCVFGLGDEASSLYITAAAPRDENAADENAKGDVATKFALYRIGLRHPGFHVFEP
jgi:sugar lactone lactonase YvrE